ncbi:LysR family transcriptional regulator [Modestobacter sp. URMC 112]
MTPRPRFTLAQLQYFVAAAETGNISAAAMRLHTSQSGMSTAIQRLERDLGCELFLRHHARGITLTASGRQLLDRAQDLLRRAGELQELGQHLQTGTSGPLSAGFYVTLAPFYVPLVLARLRAAHPRITVQVLEADNVGLHESLRSGSCDIALTYGLELGDDMAFEPITRARPYAFVSAQHPVAGRPRATLRELAQAPMVLLDLPELSRYMLGMFEQADVPLPEIIRTTSFETMRALVAAGDGFAIVSRRLHLSSGPESGIRTVTIEGAQDVETGLLRVAALRPNRRMQAFAEECRAAATALT